MFDHYLTLKLPYVTFDDIFRMSDIERVITTKGYGMQPLEKCLAEYEELNVWMRTGDGQRLKFI